MRLLANAGRDLVQVLADGVRVLGRTWPRLLALALLGAAARGAVLWITTWLSQYSSTAAVLLVPLAPLATLTSLVLMLRVCGEELPAFRDSFPAVDPWNRSKGHLSVLVQVLIPFLAVYASQGLLHEDTVSFLYDATLDEALNHALRADYARVIIAQGWTLVAIVVAALVIRKVIDGYELASRNPVWGFVGGYVEALWLVSLSAAFAAKLDQVVTWLHTRQVSQPFVQAWDSVTSWIAHASVWIKVPFDFLANALSHMGDLVIVPVAWMAVGATVYGSKLAAVEVPTHEEMTRRIKKIPDPVRRAVAHVAEPVTTPVKDTWEAIKQVSAAGILPMVAFCLIFASTNQFKVLVAWLARLIIGPADPFWLLAITPYIDLAERVVYLVTTVGLLAAAVNRLASVQAQAAPATQGIVSST